MNHVHNLVTDWLHFACIIKFIMKKGGLNHEKISFAAYVKEGVYHVYLGGEIEGVQQDGLYTSITSYTPGTLMQHGEGTAQQRVTMPADMGGMPSDMGNMQQFGAMGGNPQEMGSIPQDDMMGGRGQNMGGAQQFGGMNDWASYAEAFNDFDLNEVLSGIDLNELLKDADLNQLLTGFSITDLLTDEQIKEYFGDIDVSALEMFPGMGGGMFGSGMGNPRALESSAEVATTDFVLSRENTGFTNIVEAK